MQRTGTVGNRRGQLTRTSEARHDPAELAVAQVHGPTRVPVPLLGEHTLARGTQRLVERRHHPESPGEVGAAHLVDLVPGGEHEVAPPRRPRDLHVGDPVGRAVVEGEHPVSFGLTEPLRDEFLQQFGALHGEVVRLGRIGHRVVERPAVGREVVAALEEVAFVGGELVHVVGDRLPSVAVDGATPPQLVVLAPASRGRGVLEGGPEALAVEGHLLDTPDTGRQLQTCELQHRGQHVDHVLVLVPDPTSGVDPGPADDEGVTHPSLEGVALPAPERRVARQRPAPWVVTRAAEPTEVVDPGQFLGQVVLVVGYVVAQLVVGAVGTTLTGSPVVGDEHDDGVVELAAVLQVVEETSDLGIGVAHEGREHLHHPGIEPLLVGIQGVPFGHPVGARRQLGALGQDSQLHLPGERLLAPGVPATVEATRVGLDPVRGGLVGRVRSGRGVPHEPWPVRMGVAEQLVVLDRVVRQVHVEVVALLGTVGRLHVGVVAHQVRGPLVRLTVEESVVVLEPLAERPHPVRSGVALVARNQVPLAHAVGGVALATEDLGHCRRVLGELPAVRAEVGWQVGQHPHAHAVGVAARQQAGTGRRTHRGGVEVREPHAAPCEPVQVRSVEVRPVAPEVGEPEVVEHEHQHVRCTLGERTSRPGGSGLRHRGWALGIPGRIRRPVSGRCVVRLQLCPPESVRNA